MLTNPLIKFDKFCTRFSLSYRVLKIKKWRQVTIFIGGREVGGVYWSMRDPTWRKLAHSLPDVSGRAFQSYTDYYFSCGHSPQCSPPFPDYMYMWGFWRMHRRRSVRIQFFWIRMAWQFSENTGSPATADFPSLDSPGNFKGHQKLIVLPRPTLRC